MISPRGIMLGVIALLAVCPALAADPPCYSKKSTWQETLLAAREAQIRQAEAAGTANGFRPFATGVIRGAQPPVRVVADVSALDKLWLVATFGPDNYDYDQAIWGEPRLIAKDGKEVDLTTLKPVSAKVGWGSLLVNQNHQNQPLRGLGKAFSGGFWAHAPSALCFALDKKYQRFEAWVGIDIAASTNGSVVFKVLDKPEGGEETQELWPLLARDFPNANREMNWEREDGIWDQDWKPGDLVDLAGRYARATRRIQSLADEATKLAANVKDAAGLQPVRELYYRARVLDSALTRAKGIKFEPLRLAIEDLTKTFGEKYPKGPAYLQRLATLEKDFLAAMDKAKAGTMAEKELVAKVADELESLRYEALLANPLIDFDTLLLVRRRESNLALPANWQGNSSLPRSGIDNEIALLSPIRPEGKLATLYRPEGGRFVGDVRLHYDADRMLFSSIAKNGRWQVFEMKTDGTGLRQVTPGDQPDVDNYDACYLPDGRIIFGSTANFVGVPCVFGGDHVSMLFRCDADGKNVRQLCFEQDHDWYPAVLNNGRVLYARWEYTDTPHSQTRLLFHMNPDGTEQMEYYGSNSQWPNSFFYAKPIPGHPTKVVSVISGHHGVPRMGELIVFDPGKGRHEASGAVQRIPGHGQKVEAIIRDGLVDSSWPRFLHPWPLSEKHFLVACKPTPQTPWGIYLVDTFDNILLLHQEQGYALLEPIPLRKTTRPPVIPDRVDLARKDALIYMEDVYAGGGLRGIPRGMVKKMRLFTYQFAYHGMGGLLGVVGMDGPWDVKRIMGTVPVESDGSAFFRVPANTPFSLQPLDAEGKALQIMRSWMTAMPGETLSCVGCHEAQNTSPQNRRTLALSKPPAAIAPWYGPTRGFSYPREVQPVLDKYCVSCHDGTARPNQMAGDVRRGAGDVGAGPRARPLIEGGQAQGPAPTFSSTVPVADLRGTVMIKDFSSVIPGTGGGNGGRFSVGYAELHRYVRRPGIESDYHLLTPMEYHADATELVQLLQRGHYGVRLSPEAWDRLITWIDLNAPFHGTWTDTGHNPGRQRERRRELGKLYANLDVDPEADAQLKPAILADQVAQVASSSSVPENRTPKTDNPALPGWPLTPAEAQKLQQAAGPVTKRTLDLGGGMKLELVLIPAGEFLMGDPDGYPDEQPVTRVKIGKPFWLGKFEVTNEQYARFDPAHDSHVESKNAYQFGVHGYPCDGPKQPVVRVPWTRAMAFCEWLSQKAGEKITLPTEAQWEYTCRAGTATAFSFGGLDADYSKHANLADMKIREMAGNPYTTWEPLPNATKYDDWVPHDTRFNDGALVATDVGKYQPNAWDLHDMHGNVAEWTRSLHRPYPPNASDGSDKSDLSDRPAGAGELRRVARGGGWRDRPFRSRSAARFAYHPYQPVFDVGFRVLAEFSPDKKVAATEK